MTVADNRRHRPDAFVDELAEIEKRQSGAKPLQDNLVGIAFSGGGIRSATFGLGVLEGLKPFGLLKHIHYLSTVSGGGYIGAWLSANCKRAAERKAADPKVPEWLDPAADWTPSIAHLRRYSNYLSPKVGFFSADTWSMVMIWIRNFLLVQVTVILAIAVILLLTMGGRLASLRRYRGCEHPRQAPSPPIAPSRPSAAVAIGGPERLD